MRRAESSYVNVLAATRLEINYRATSSDPRPIVGIYEYINRAARGNVHGRIVDSDGDAYR